MAEVRALALVMLLGGAASAAPLIKAPDGWKGGASDELVHETGALPHFGNVHGIVEAERYDPPKPGVVLYVTRVAATTNAHDEATRAEIDQLRPVPPSTVRETEWQEHFDAASKQADVRYAYRDGSVNLSGRVHMVIAATADRVVAAKAECIAADDADAAAVKACAAALEGVDTGVDAKDRVAINLDAKPSGTSTSTSTSTTMTEPTGHTPLPPMAVPQEKPAMDLRPVVIGAGIVLLAGVFWWNRRRRARYEAENRGDNSANER
jgi:hypothetical protein